MSRKYLGTMGITLLALLAFPTAGQASIWDWIWGMSGPQMVGAVLHCEYDLQHKTTDKEDVIECRALDYLFYNQLKPRPMRRVWLSLDSGLYTSTGKDSSEGNEFGWFENHMVAFEPLLEVRSYTSDNVMLNHGLIGMSYDVLFGSKFSIFDKAGFKFRPIAISIKKKFNASVTVRYYPNRFTAEEFGLVAPNPVSDDGEFVYGFTMGWLWSGR